MSNKAVRWLLGLLAALALTACVQQPGAARPALWLVEGPGDQKAWLFGTIHALSRPYDWKSDKIAAALAQSDRLILEVADVGDDAATARVFAQLAQGGTHPPLTDRVDQQDRDELERELKAEKLAPGSLDPYDTWAAALMIAQAQARQDRQDSGNGIDRALAANFSRPIDEFEGAEVQLAIFDALPEAQQRALLHTVIEDDPAQREAKVRALEQAWADGDMVDLAKVSDIDTFGDPLLREALLVGRNRNWADRLVAMLGKRARPFVAVGAAHLAGPDGLPAMLAARGYKVTRIQ